MTPLKVTHRLFRFAPQTQKLVMDFFLQPERDVCRILAGKRLPGKIIGDNPKYILQWLGYKSEIQRVAELEPLLVSINWSYSNLEWWKELEKTLPELYAVLDQTTRLSCYYLVTPEELHKMIQIKGWGTSEEDQPLFLTDPKDYAPLG